VRRWKAQWLIPLLALGSAAASSDTRPTVVTALPGGAGQGAAVERFTVRFSEPMVPLGDPRAASPFAVRCPVGGEGRWIDQKSWVYEFTRPLPGGLACTFDLKDKLTSLRGATVGGQRRFPIDTGGPEARAVLPSRYGGDVEEDQVFLVAANVVPDRASVAANAYCAVDGIGEKIAVDLLAPDLPAKLLAAMGPDRYEVSSFLREAGLPDNLPASAADRQAATRTMIALKCRRPLPPGHDMALVWGAGISGPGGRKAGKDQRFDFTVRKAFEARFECPRVNPNAGCNPVQDARLRFTAPIPIATAKAIRLHLASGRDIAPTFGDDAARKVATVTDVTFKAPLPEGMAGSVRLPDRVVDDSGRPLANAQRFPLDIRFDVAPPLVKFAAPFGILEAGEGGVLPVTVRHVEPALGGRMLAGVDGKLARMKGEDGAIAAWLRRVDKANKSDFREEGEGKARRTVNYTGATPLLAKADAKPLNVALPGKGKQFEVVGIPLGKPGFYVVELASPVLGRALLGRPATRYVTAAALVTNMAVHFEWGRSSSLVWVTALDSGKPVPGADIRVTDSCTGKSFAAGRADAVGRLRINGSLTEPETYGSCDENSPHPLMVSARKGDDFSFTMTGWGEGIRPYDFDLPYGYGDAGDIFHTVFDRALLRAGETVNMKHIVRRPVAKGFAFTGAKKGILRLSHRGSDTHFDLPVTIGADGIGETRWTAPKGAPEGDYALSFLFGDDTVFTSQTLRLEEYRLPTMRASITGPRAPVVHARTVPLALYAGYLSGGGASGLPVSVRAAFDPDFATPKGWDGWSFGGKDIIEGVRPLDGDGEEIGTPTPAAQTIPLMLDAEGAAHTSIAIPATIDRPTTMTVEMDYQDANGEVLTASSRIPIHPAAIRVGLKTDGWMMKADDLRLKMVVLDLDGRPVKGKRVAISLYSREILSARRRLIGGFYAYDNNARTTKLASNCVTSTDAQGLAECRIEPGTSGELYAVASASDDAGNISRAVRSIWVAGDEDWWFGGDNGDRMDVVPEQRTYKAGDTARLQVRMPFREATALVTVEREGVLKSFVTHLSGKNAVVEVPLEGAYAPNVYVSVLAVRGRVSGWRLWLADFARRWHLPFFGGGDGARPTALVDLAKPSYRLGIAKITVGWETHRLAVDVKADKTKYRVRETAEVSVQVRDPSGKPPPSAEIAFAAVDEALLQLAPNPSWQVLDAMMGERPLSVLTATAQTQVVGKRHYGRKAVASGGGGGGDLSALNRADFRPVLLWRGRVKLDAQGRARIAVPLSDSLSAFRLVAIATAGADRFGTGETSVRTTQDLTLYSGLPPTVRAGDLYGASFTLRNGSDRPMKVTASVDVKPRVATGPALTVTIPAGGAVPITWHMPAPAGIGSLAWTVHARAADGRAADQLTVDQTIVPAVPVTTWAATLLRVGPASSVTLTPPVGALPGRGGVEVRLSSTLAPPLDGVRAYMADYPYACFEQRLSKAVVAGDAAAWSRLAADLPAYLDREGLLRYFPSSTLEGSEALTAYVLSMTAEAGFALPEGPRARMIEAMKAVVDGRLQRENAASGDPRFQRLAAFAALARNGAATPAMLGQIGLAPADMPTGLLADWLVATRAVRGANPALAQAAETALRGRLVYEGSRLDLADAAAAPWWMMASGDESVLKALIAILGRPGWQEEAPRMMVGASLRQRHGHWDTPPANAWGVIAAKRFAALYPAGAVAGTTTTTLGGVTRRQHWPIGDTPALLRLTLPSQKTPLALTQSGGAGPWAEVAVRAAVPLTKPLFAGYRITRSVTPLQQRVKGRLTRGDVLKVRITVEASAGRNWVVVNDPIPAGATIVGDLGGQSQILAAQASGGEGAQPSYVERGQDAWRGYFAWVPRGRFTVEYAVRLNGSGRLQLPPTRVEALYSPDIRGEAPNAPLTVALR